MGVELFERAVEGGGVLLQVETRSGGVGAGAGVVSNLLLTFDVGCVQVSSNSGHVELAIEPFGSADGRSAELANLSEEEPWWRLVGFPITRVWPAGEALTGGLCLQFRLDDQQPCIVTLEPRGSEVAVGLERLGA